MRQTNLLHLTFTQPNCPVTCGQPTRMTKKTFAQMCARRHFEGSYQGHQHDVKSRCSVCPGIPDEVEFVADFNGGSKA
jgi:hypothetical protein